MLNFHLIQFVSGKPTIKINMAAQTTADDIGKLAYEGNFSIFRIKIEQNNSLASKKDTVGLLKPTKQMNRDILCS